MVYPHKDQLHSFFQRPTWQVVINTPSLSHDLITQSVDFAVARSIVNCLNLDKQDSIAHLRHQFALPPNVIYLHGNFTVLCTLTSDHCGTTNCRRNQRTGAPTTGNF